ncbi:GntR family transcriptional regulator [Oerskovia sp. M15]
MRTEWPHVHVVRHTRCAPRSTDACPPWRSARSSPVGRPRARLRRPRGRRPGAVLSGTVAPHTRLPSERDLAGALGVSRTTTAAAYAALRERGFVTSRTGVGTVAVLPAHAPHAAAVVRRRRACPRGRRAS